MERPEEINFGFSYDSKKIWALDIPTEEVDIDFLSANLDLPYLEKEGTDDWNLTPRLLMNTLEKEPSHRKKIETANPRYPIEIYFHKGSWKILDGVHRYCKAIIQGLDTVKVRKVTPEMIPQIRR